MGRKTYESLGQPLPGRRNMVLTRRLPLPGVECFPTLDAALQACGDATVFIIGGAEVYRQALPLADALCLTRLHRNVPGDTQFPAFDVAEWKEAAREDFPEYSFIDYERRTRPSTR
jgi:dihydrofolate reductase